MPVEYGGGDDDRYAERMKKEGVMHAIIVVHEKVTGMGKKVIRYRFIYCRAWWW